MAHEDSFFSGVFVSKADPQFVNRSADDFDLSGSSAVIDYCDSSFTPANYKDMDGDVRGWDDYTVSGIVSFLISVPTKLISITLSLSMALIN